jgi:parallel beta-helix repeat protein
MDNQWEAGIMKTTGANTTSFLSAENRCHMTAIAALGLFLALFLFLTLAPVAEAASMYVLRNDATGGDCPAIGVWNDTLDSCTLLADIAVVNPGDTAIEIVDDGITLDGIGHEITGLGATFPPPFPDVWVPEFAVKLTDVEDTEVGYLVIHDIDAGIQLNGSNSNQIYRNEIRDCSHGVWVVLGTDNRIEFNDFSDNIWAGVDLVSADANTVVDNTIISSPNWGVRLFEADGNSISSNEISNTGTPAAGTGTGVYIYYSNANFIFYNTLAGALFGANTDVGVGTEFFRNNFIGNVNQAEDDGGNIFNLVPLGGNTWDDFDEPAEGCLDTDIDGFCDAPYIFTGNQDNLPRAGRPGLGLHLDSVYWESYARYLSRLLTADYTLSNTGAVDAIDARVLGTVNTNGVTDGGILPVYMGDIDAGDSAPFTLSYSVPPETGSFRSVVYLTAENDVGIRYEYPGPFPGP